MSRWLRASLIVAVAAGVIAGSIIAALHPGPAGPSLVDLESGLVAALAMAAAFVIVYSVREPWWSNWIGRFIVSHVLAFAFVCLPFVLSFFFDFNRFDNLVAEWVLLGSFYAAAAILALGTILWLHTSMTRARERKEQEKETQ